MYSNADKERFLEELRKTPVVQVACQKTNLSRTTYYRFRRESKKFAETADLALEEGRAVANDLGEATTLSLMKDRDMNAVRFWLTHNHPRYANKLEISGSINHSTGPLTPELSKLLRRAIKLALQHKNYGLKKDEQEKSDDESEDENQEG